MIAELAADLERRERLGTEIGALFDAHPLGRTLITLLAVGPRTRERILAKIGDRSRFATGARLAADAERAPPPGALAAASAASPRAGAGQPPAHERCAPDGVLRVA